MLIPAILGIFLWFLLRRQLWGRWFLLLSIAATPCVGQTLQWNQGSGVYTIISAGWQENGDPKKMFFYQGENFSGAFSPPAGSGLNAGQWASGISVYMRDFGTSWKGSVWVVIQDVNSGDIDQGPFLLGIQLHPHDSVANYRMTVSGYDGSHTMYLLRAQRASSLHSALGVGYEYGVDETIDAYWHSFQGIALYGDFDSLDGGSGEAFDPAGFGDDEEPDARRTDRFNEVSGEKTEDDFLGSPQDLFTASGVESEAAAVEVPFMLPEQIDISNPQMNWDRILNTVMPSAYGDDAGGLGTSTSTTSAWYVMGTGSLAGTCNWVWGQLLYLKENSAIAPIFPYIQAFGVLWWTWILLKGTYSMTCWAFNIKEAPQLPIG